MSILFKFTLAFEFSPAIAIKIFSFVTLSLYINSSPLDNRELLLKPHNGNELHRRRNLIWQVHIDGLLYCYNQEFN